LKRLRINGDAREFGAETVAELVTELGIRAGMVLVEHNGVALRPGEWTSVSLTDGDRVELMRLVAGG
jgi:sulfur carrier protein